MQRCIISTVGQSIFSNAEPYLKERFHAFGREKIDKLKVIVDAENDFPGQELYRLRLDTLIAQSTDITSLRRASAELNSLIAIVKQQDIPDGHLFYLLATATPDGVLAARVLRDFCRQHFNHAGVEVRIIHGLQVRDVQLFLREGLPSLIEAIYSILDQTKGYEPLFNPTGGFKAVIPYFALVGMLKKIEMAYLYEFSDELVALSPLPIDFNVGVITPYYDVLNACENGLPASDLQQRLGLSNQPVEAHPLWSLFMRDDNQYMLSGLGEIIYRTLNEQQSKQAVYLSKRVWEDYQKADAKIRQNLEAWFQQMQDEGWRLNQAHATINDVKVAKLASNDRLFYFEEEDGAILIAELARHSDQSYERLSADFTNQHRTRSHYERWHYWGS
ncbi:MAG: putative CRISPR-associated protein [Anaerolineae bacterium]|nr:MAG: putative CRISPR-associated protein [Anaerolineae bacterium]